MGKGVYKVRKESIYCHMKRILVDENRMMKSVFETELTGGRRMGRPLKR